MRRPILALLAALCLLLAGPAAHSRVAVGATYAAGWNLVAGPDGSVLTGASGTIYSWQSGDSNYESFPANSPLKACLGYWAFFPSGGSITFGTGNASCSVDLRDGEFVQIGNPSATSNAVVRGADVAYTYTPAAGYQSTTQIPPGQGAWISASGTVTLSLAPAPQAPPPTTSQPSPQGSPTTRPAGTISTFDGLKAVALNQGDLPGFSLQSEKPDPNPLPLPGELAGYHAVWLRTSPPTAVSVNIASFGDTTNSHTLFSLALPAIQQDTTNMNVASLGSQGVGEEDLAIAYQYTGSSSGVVIQGYLEAFRRGTVAVFVFLNGQPGVLTLQPAVGYARIIDGRLASLSSRLVASAPGALQANRRPASDWLAALAVDSRLVWDRPVN